MLASKTAAMTRNSSIIEEDDEFTGMNPIIAATEQDPLLPKACHSKDDSSPIWVKPPGFLWVEIAIFANVFLSGFDGTVTASTYALISSEFKSSNLASWITTAYLVTSTALQPLYGRFSDIFGRRVCLMIATTLFGLGCLGCSLSPDLITLIIMRGITGVGGGGLMTMATIINSDLIPPKQRGMYQAVQNVLHGFGSIAGATLGGVISNAIGWRYCFLFQVPVSIIALLIARTVIKSQPKTEVISEGEQIPKRRSMWEQIDIRGACLLFVGLSLQLAAMSMGSNDLSWTHPAILSCLVISTLLLGCFFVVEGTTKAIPLMPLDMLKSAEKAALLIASICFGISGYGFLFLMPLFFQAVLLDSASVAGLRLVAPSLATPLGGLTTGIVMRHGDRLTMLTRGGLVLLMIGGCLNLSLGMADPLWKYSVYLLVGSFGQGMVYPSSLFGFIRTIEHSEHAVATSLVYLVRSMGAVWGVACVSTITQSVLISRLESAFSTMPGGEEVIDALKHSVEALRDLPPDFRYTAQTIYYEACRTGFFFLLSVNIIAFVCSLIIPFRKKGETRC